MFDCESLPDDNGDLASVLIDLPRLAIDSPSGAPASLEELLAYLKLEVDGGADLTSSDLTFSRTVDLGEAEYWVWSFAEPVGGAPAYATVRRDALGRTPVPPLATPAGRHVTPVPRALSGGAITISRSLTLSDDDGLATRI